MMTEIKKGTSDLGIKWKPIQFGDVKDVSDRNGCMETRIKEFTLKSKNIQR